MADEFSLLEHPLTGGVDQHTDARKVAGALMLRAENARIVKSGRWDKRYGVQTVTTTVLTGAAIATNFTTLHKRGTDFLVSERARLLSRSSEKDRLVNVDTMPDVYATDVGLPQTGGYIWNPDVATIVGAADYTCTVYAQSSTATISASAASEVYVVIQDANTGTVLIRQSLGSGNPQYSPRVLAIGNIFIVVWSEGANIRYQRIDMSVSVPAFDTRQTIRADHTGVNGVFDICPASTAGTWVLAYQTGAGAARVVSLYRYDNAAVPAQQATATTGDAHDADYVSIAVADGAGPGALGVVYIYRDPVPAPDDDVVRAAYHNRTTLANTVAAFDVFRQASPVAVICSSSGATIVGTSSTTFQVAWTNQSIKGAIRRQDDHVRAETLSAAGAVTGTPRTIGAATMASKLLSTNGTTYALVSVQTQNAAASFVLATGAIIEHSMVLFRFNGESTDGDGVPARAVCSVAPRVGSASIHEPSHLANLVFHADSATSSFLSAYGEIQYAIKTPATQSYRVALCKLTLEQSSRQSCELGGLTYFTGGVPTWYDGIQTGEVGFLCSPNVTLTPSNGAGSLDVAAVYQYAIVQTHRDAAGNVHRGIPWKAAVTMGGADDTVTVDIPYFPTQRNSGESGFEVYRSEGGGTLLRLLQENLSNINAAGGALTITDLDADTALASKQILYDTATPDGRSQLAHVNPPSATLCMTHRDRVWFAGCPNRKEIWISSKYTPREAVFFSEAFRIIVDDGGDITAIASMDGKAIVFKRDRVFYVTGDGPDDAGQSSDWSAPERIIGTVGCIDARSVVVTPIGIVFRSTVGLSLLSRSLEILADFGQSVEDTLSGRTITAATLHETATEIRFLLDTGTEIRYDYRAKAWMIATLPTVSAAPAVSAWVNGTLYYLLNSQLYREDPTTFKDEGTTFVPMTLELAPVSAAGRLGMQNVVEVQCLFDRVQDHDLKIEISADGDSYPAGEAKVWDATTLQALGSEYVLSKKPAKSTKGRVMKVRISDVAPTPGEGGLVMGTGAGYRLVACAFKVAVKEGPYKLMGASAKG